MNIPPRSPASIYTASYLTQFQQRVREKSQNFVGRSFIFTAISDFINCHNAGYFTIVGVPGSGKSAVLAKYVTSHPFVVYYTAEVECKNQAEEFLRNICTQLIHTIGDIRGEKSLSIGKQTADQIKSDPISAIALPDNATQGSWFLSLLLQKISDLLEPPQHLIIAIDGLDRIDPNSQSAGSNLFYLPRYLPDRVYFLLTRRPFPRDRSGLLIETASQTLDLANYPEQNRKDVQAYIQQYLTEQKFITRLTAASENNFMYLSQILPTIAPYFDPNQFDFEQLPPGLEAYYQSHWQRMKKVDLSSFELAVLYVLVRQEQPISAHAIAQIIDQDEYEVELALENWLEFLQQQPIKGEMGYSLYHSNFRKWLGKQL